MVDRSSVRILKPLEQVFGQGTVAGLTDAQLLERYAFQGDPSAFEALMTRYGPMVLGVCRRRLRDGHAAEDAFQATFLVLVRKAGSIRVGRSIGPWIHGVAWRVAERARVEASRRSAREVSGRAAELVPAQVDSESKRRELAEILDRELLRLPEKYRVPVVLCHLEGLTHEEAAQRMGCPTGTVSIRLMRAQTRLRDRLARQEGSTMALALLMTREMPFGVMTAPGVPAGLFDDVLRAAIGKGIVPPVALELTAGVLRTMMHHKIRKAAIGIASIGLVVTLATLAVAFRPQTPKASNVVNGQVIDDQGQPIPGAEVWLPIQLIDHDLQNLHDVTDAKGRFTLPIPKNASKDDMAMSRSSLWVFAKGHSIGTGQVVQVLSGENTADVTIRLGSSTDTAFNVVGPDGRPVAGARVEPHHILAPNNVYDFPPKGMQPLVGGVTNAQGFVKLPSLDRKGFSEVAVVTEAFGYQTLRLTDKADEPAERTIRLRPVGQVEGRIVASRPELARGIKLYLSTEEANQLGGWAAEGHAEVVSDEQGKFSVTALASGTMNIDGAVDPKLPVRLRLPQQVMVRPGDKTEIELPMDPAVKVRGIVRSSETKAPLAKATISVGYGTWRQSDTVTTGSDGKFEAFVVPGKVRLHVIMVPEGYVQLGAPWDEPIAVPADVEAFDLPSIDLVKSLPPIKGRLVDGRDRALGNVQIIAISGNRRYGFARTDAQGSFTLDGIPPGVDLNYEAWTENENAGPAEITSGIPLVLRARLKAEAIEEAGPSASISCRVIDREGKPVDKADLILVETVYNSDGQYLSGRRWERFGTTDARGSFRKAFALVKGTSYHLIVQPGTSAIATTKDIRADGQNPVVFPTIVADRLREVVGVVEDRQGKPIAGATVLNWGNESGFSSTLTDTLGKFRLGGFPQGDVFVFGDATGYRFQGVRLASGEGPVRLVLSRADQPPSRTLPTTDPVLPRPVIHGMALGVIAADIDPILKGNDQNSQSMVLDVLARMDLDAAWEKVRVGEKPWDGDLAKLAVFRGYRTRDPATARAVLSLVKSSWHRLRGFEQLYDQMPAEPIEPRKALMTSAMADARRFNDPAFKNYFMRHAARRLADLGETLMIRGVVDELLEPAKVLDARINRPEATQALAGLLGRVDPQAAEAMIPKDGDERSRNDILGSVAEGVASNDPARAERLIGQFTHNSSEVFTIHVCRRMAVVDLPRARRLAGSIKSDGLRAYAFGLMAEALAKADPVASSKLLDESFRAFSDTALRGTSNLWSSQASAVMAASLLPVVEQVCPDRLDEFVWRVVSFRWQPRTVMDLTMSIPDTSRYVAMNQAAGLALFLARYDRDLARVILNPVVGEFLATPDGTEVSWMQWRLILVALAQVDPARAVELVKLVPNVKEAGNRVVREDARVTIANAMVQTIEEAITGSRIWITDLELILREDH